MALLPSTADGQGAEQGERWDDLEEEEVGFL
eukprot:COSAG05_NODE_17984_length_316_cov_0.631336_1_plen_30_part_10